MANAAEAFVLSLTKVVTYMEKTKEGRRIKDEFMGVTGNFLVEMEGATSSLAKTIEVCQQVLVMMNHLIEEVTNEKPDKKSLERLKVRTVASIDQIKNSTKNLPVGAQRAIRSQFRRYVTMIDKLLIKAS